MRSTARPRARAERARTRQRRTRAGLSPTLGWDDLAPSIERHEVAGTHFTLLAPHRIEALARTISRHLPR
jgi:thioesterase domain-containing protein